MTSVANQWINYSENILSYVVKVSSLSLMIFDKLLFALIFVKGT